MTSVTLNTGAQMPTVGLGTFRACDPGEVSAAVKSSVLAGYRLIDCAAAYGNQAEIGDAISELIADGVVERHELFVVSKLFQTHHDWEGDGSRCLASLDQTLAELQLNYLDLFLIHWPFAFEQIKLEMPPGTPQPLRLPDGSPNPIWNVKMEYLKTWSVMESMVDSGKVKAIGVSNFTSKQLEHLITRSAIVPAVNQVELHPYLYQKELIDFCSSAGIRVMGYSPLGSGFGKGPEEHSGIKLLLHPTVQAVANATNKTPGQVLIRWSLQRADIVIPKSSNPKRIAENLDVLDWSLADDQVAELDKLSCNFRYFISYLKKPGNDIKWHDEQIEA